MAWRLTSGAGGLRAAVRRQSWRKRGRHTGRLTGGTSRRAPAADGDAVAVEDQRAIGLTRGITRAHAATNRQSAANRPFIGCEGARQRFTHVADSLRLLGKQPLAPTLFRRFANLGRFVAPYGERIQQLAALSEQGRDLAWKRVYGYVPEAHVRFNHAPHIRAEVECATCHGNIGEQGIAQSTFVEWLRERAPGMTEATGDDATTALDLLTAVEGPLVRVTADAAYDTVAVYETAGARGATVVIPPARTANVSGHGPQSPARDRTITSVKQLGRRLCVSNSQFSR